MVSFYYLEHGVLTASNIMEKIFEIEDSESEQSGTHSHTDTRLVENPQTSAAAAAATAAAATTTTPTIGGTGESRNSHEDANHSPTPREENPAITAGQEGNCSRRQDVSNTSSSGSSQAVNKQMSNNNSSSRKKFEL